MVIFSKKSLLRLSIELVTRCMIIVWITYLNATKTQIYDSNINKILIPIVFLIWIILPIFDFWNAWDINNKKEAGK